MGESNKSAQRQLGHDVCLALVVIIALVFFSVLTTSCVDGHHALWHALGAWVTDVRDSLMYWTDHEGDFFSQGSQPWRTIGYTVFFVMLFVLVVSLTVTVCRNNDSNKQGGGGALEDTTDISASAFRGEGDWNDDSNSSVAGPAKRAARVASKGAWTAHDVVWFSVAAALVLVLVVAVGTSAAESDHNTCRTVGSGWKWLADTVGRVREGTASSSDIVALTAFCLALFIILVALVAFLCPWCSCLGRTRRPTLSGWRNYALFHDEDDNSASSTGKPLPPQYIRDHPSSANYTHVMSELQANLRAKQGSNPVTEI